MTGFRGLPPGIIPARAGFTMREGKLCVILWDHPRACGVYLSSRRRWMLTLGSSPRVRGLRGHMPEVGARSRIIPARAGFTCSGVYAGSLF